MNWQHKYVTWHQFFLFLQSRNHLLLIQDVVAVKVRRTFITRLNELRFIFYSFFWRKNSVFQKLDFDKDLFLTPDICRPGNTPTHVHVVVTIQTTIMFCLSESSFLGFSIHILHPTISSASSLTYTPSHGCPWRKLVPGSRSLWKMEKIGQTLLASWVPCLHELEVLACSQGMHVLKSDYKALCSTPPANLHSVFPIRLPRDLQPLWSRDSELDRCRFWSFSSLDCSLWTSHGVNTNPSNILQIL